MIYDDMQTYLDALNRESWYNVRQVLKRDAASETQLVSYPDLQHGAETGPYVRKIMDANVYDGKAYQILYEGQRQGIRISCVPTILECYKTESRFVVVTEFVPGETLHDYVQRHGGSLQAVQTYFPAICDAVSELHTRFAQPIIHRDLKPSNIIVSEGKAFIIDFGISRLFNEESETDTTHFGTRAYAPPEQFGFGQTDVRTDVYALGKLLQFCLTATEPKESAASLPAPSGIPPKLWNVVRKATSFDPKDRYATATALKRAAMACFDKGRPSLHDLNPTALVSSNGSAAKRNGEGSSENEASSTREHNGISALRAHHNDSETLFQMMTTVAKRIWNGALVVVLLLMAFITVGVAMDPPDSWTGFPFPLCLFITIGMFFIPGAMILYLLSFRRKLRTKIPLIANWTWKKELPVFLGVAFAVVIVTFFLAMGCIALLEIR